MKPLYIVLFSFYLLFSFAPLLAQHVNQADLSGNRVEWVVYVIQQRFIQFPIQVRKTRFQNQNYLRLL